ncbi:MAG: hypothetical protein ACTSO5_11785 [Candidatus Heimdallarchaeaceae archaeon]
MKDEIITPYLTEDVTLSKNTPFHVFKEIMKITAWRRFAHHPTCSQYENHYFSFGALKLCVGCTSLYSTIIIVFFVYGFGYPFFRKFPIILAATFIFGTTSAIFHFLIKPENKWLKSLLRVFAGFGIGSFVGLIIFLRVWWLQLIMSLMLAGGYLLYGIMRGVGHNLEDCESCPMHTAEIPCNPRKNTQIRIRKINELMAKNLEEERKRKERGLKIN